MSRILIVEDDVAYANLLIEYFKEQQIPCHAFYSGNDAIDWLNSSSCRMILTDIRMDNGSGIDLIRWNSKGPQIPIIAMSGDSESKMESTQLCEILDIPFLAKPINFSELFKLVDAKGELQKV